MTTTVGRIVDVLSIIVVFGLPLVLIIRWKWIGLIIGFALFWFGPILSWECLHIADPNYELGILQAGWMAMGWLPAIIYCGLIFGSCVLVRILRKNKPQLCASSAAANASPAER